MRERELPSAFRACLESGLEPLAEPTVLGRVDVSPNPDHPAPAPAPSPVRTQIPRRCPKSSNPPPPTLGRIVLLRGQPLSSAQVLAMARAAGDFRWTLKSYPLFLSSPGPPLHSPRTIPVRISTAARWWSVGAAAPTRERRPRLGRRAGLARSSTRLSTSGIHLASACVCAARARPMCTFSPLEDASVYPVDVRVVLKTARTSQDVDAG